MRRQRTAPARRRNRSSVVVRAVARMYRSAWRRRQADRNRQHDMPTPMSNKPAASASSAPADRSRRTADRSGRVGSRAANSVAQASLIVDLASQALKAVEARRVSTERPMRRAAAVLRRQASGWLGDATDRVEDWRARGRAAKRWRAAYLSRIVLLHIESASAEDTRDLRRRMVSAKRRSPRGCATIGIGAGCGMRRSICASARIG